MSLLEKIKLLFKIKDPLTSLANTVSSLNQSSEEEKKKGSLKKWIHFSVLVLSSLSATVLALQGTIPALTQLILITVLQSLYNILRGLDKADSTEIKGTFRTTECWTTALSELQKGFIALHTGGFNPEWLAMASTITGMALAAGQNLAARAPVSGLPEPTSTLGIGEAQIKEEIKKIEEKLASSNPLGVTEKKEK